MALEFDIVVAFVIVGEEITLILFEFGGRSFEEGCSQGLAWTANVAVGH